MITKNFRGRTFRWTRLIPCKWEDAWVERLNEAQGLAITILPGLRSARLEVYCARRKAENLLKHFGGKISVVKDSQWKSALDGFSRPISIRGKLLIHQTSSSFLHAYKKSRHNLFFPAEMAFGSGAHVTTASCLRMLCDLSEVMSPKWKMLDLGTGSGILAVAACIFGAREVLGVDFDPVAVRIARCNWRRNRLKVGRIKPPQFQKMDLLENFPVGKYDIVCANLFAEILIRIAHRVLLSLEPRGSWIFSGVLSEQTTEVVAAIQDAGFAQPKVTHCGKWMVGIVQKPD